MRAAAIPPLSRSTLWRPTWWAQGGFGAIPTAALDPDRLADPRSAGPEDADLARLLSGLTSLSSEHREVLLLCFVDDLSLKEIAETLSIPLGTVKSRLHLAVRKLKSHPEIKRFRKP